MSCRGSIRQCGSRGGPLRGRRQRALLPAASTRFAGHLRLWLIGIGLVVVCAACEPRPEPATDRSEPAQSSPRAVQTPSPGAVAPGSKPPSPEAARSPGGPPSRVAADPLAEAVPAAPWLDSLRAAHSQTDAAVTREERKAALRSLEQVLGDIPPVGAGAVWAKQDVASRVARLHLALGDPNQALGAARSGLEVSSAPSVAVADLLWLEGQALESLNRKSEAIEAYHQALVVNETLMKRSLGDDE